MIQHYWSYVRYRLKKKKVQRERWSVQLSCFKVSLFYSASELNREHDFFFFNEGHWSYVNEEHVKWLHEKKIRRPHIQSVM